MTGFVFFWGMGLWGIVLGQVLPSGVLWIGYSGIFAKVDWEKESSKIVADLEKEGSEGSEEGGEERDLEEE